ncbi:recombinase family protein [Streptomyces longwoodensis]|uniref:recombinase family protein n=1 Tax=Streptomyces longwoodensis TaxID=68231 RepID=UPI0036E6AE8F
MPYAPEYLHLVFPGVVFQAWLYGRNSDDALKTGDSVEDQLTTGRTLCRDYNWAIAHEFKDTGISASRHGRKMRDDFEDLLDTIAETPEEPGVRRIVVAYEASRYYRDLEAYVRLRAACLSSNTLLCYNGQVYDLSRRDDRKTTAQHAVDAEDEAEGIYARNLRTATLQAEQGKPHGKMLYGYLREYAMVGGRRRCTGQYEDPVRGPFVYQALVHIDSGKSVNSLVQWLRSTPEAARPDGREWCHITVRRMLLNRAYLGERLHHGTYVKATWPPIKGLDSPEGRALFNRVTARLTDPARRFARGTDVAHLQSYIALCGECGDHKLLNAWPRKGGVMLLGCNPHRHVSIVEDVADAYVEEAVVEWFSRKEAAHAALVPDQKDVSSRTAAIQRLINGYQEQLREARTLARTFNPDTGRPMLPAASLAEMEQDLGPKLEREQAKLRELTGVSPLLLDMLAAEDPDVVWNGRPAEGGQPGKPGLTLEQKREILKKVVTVRLYKPRKAGGRTIELDRIRLSFVGEPGFRDRPLRAPETARDEAGPAGPGLVAVPASGTG